MHDLDTIIRRNAEAAAAQLGTSPQHLTQQVVEWRAAGAYVVARYTGLHLINVTRFASGHQAIDEFERLSRAAGVTDQVKLFPPTNLHTPTPVRTLGDYVNRVLDTEGGTAD